MVDYRRALTFWSVMFLKKSEEKNYNWNKDNFGDWFKTLPSTVDFQDDDERKLFVLLIKESFTQMINVCAKGNLGGPDGNIKTLR